MRSYLLSAVIISFIGGALNLIFGILMLAAVILIQLGVMHPQSPGNFSTAGGYTVSCLFMGLGLPGILALFYRKKKSGRIFARISAVILMINAAAFPLALGGPLLISFMLFFFASAGIWVMLVVGHPYVAQAFEEEIQS